MTIHKFRLMIDLTAEWSEFNSYFPNLPEETFRKRVRMVVNQYLDKIRVIDDGVSVNGSFDQL